MEFRNVQELRKTANVVERYMNKDCSGKMTTKGTTATKRLELESSHEILSIKEDNRQIMIEFRDPSISTSSIGGTDGDQTNQDGLTEIKVAHEIEFDATGLSIPTAGAERHNYHDNYDGSTAIKIEDELEFCALSSTIQYIAEPDDEEHNNHAIHYNGERSTPVQSIPTSYAETQKYQTIQDEFTDIEDEIEFSEIVASKNTPETTFADKPEENKDQSDICFQKYSTQWTLGKNRLANMTAHRNRHDKKNFHCQYMSYISHPTATPHRKKHCFAICPINLRPVMYVDEDASSFVTRRMLANA